MESSVVRDRIVGLETLLVLALPWALVLGNGASTGCRKNAADKGSGTGAMTALPAVTPCNVQPMAYPHDSRIYALGGCTTCPEPPRPRRAPLAIRVTLKRVEGSMDWAKVYVPDMVAPHLLEIAQAWSQPSVRKVLCAGDVQLKYNIDKHGTSRLKQISGPFTQHAALSLMAAVGRPAESWKPAKLPKQAGVYTVVLTVTPLPGAR